MIKAKFEKGKLIIGLIALVIILLCSELTPLKLYRHWGEIQYTKGSLKLGLYFLGQIGSSFAVIILLLSEVKSIRWSSFLLLFLALFTEYTYTFINGYGFHYNEIVTALNELSFIADSLTTFRHEIIYSALVTTFILSMVYVISKKIDYLFKKKYIIVIPFLLIPSFLVMLKSNTAVDRFPSIVRIPMTLLISKVMSKALYVGPREAPSFLVKHDYKFKNIVLVIDESIHGQYLGINNSKINTTPYLNSIKDRIINLGLTLSSNNCSAASNAAIVTGFLQRNIPDRKHELLRSTNLYRYAKEAGYSVHYLDAQKTGGELQNYMSNYDLQYLDTFYQVEHKTNDGGEYSDFRLAEKIKKILGNGKKNLIVLNKMGSHFHYNRRYPKKESVFLPVMESGDSVSDIKKLKNSYYNSIRWNTDGFFRVLDGELIRDDTAWIYTSDHGQGLMKGKELHCMSTGAPIDQFIVPIFLIGPKLSNSFNSIEMLKNKTLQEQILPSILIWMGFDEKDVGLKYAVPLWKEYPFGSQKRKTIGGDFFGEGISEVEEYASDKINGQSL